MASFLRQNRLDSFLTRGDFAGFARGYNGPAFGRNGYDRKIAAAYGAACRRLARPEGLRDRQALRRSCPKGGRSV